MDAQIVVSARHICIFNSGVSLLASVRRSPPWFSTSMFLHKRFCILKCVQLRRRPRPIADWARLTSTAILQIVLD
eukprot:928218-Lingulodinium_polyedra.AAC.1